MKKVPFPQSTVTPESLAQQLGISVEEVKAISEKKQEEAKKLIAELEKSHPSGSRFWISWYEPYGDDGDYRSLLWPLPTGIVRYWCTGHTLDNRATLCAVVDAFDEEAAKQLVSTAFKPGEWRFCEAKEADFMPAPDRFPVARP